MEIKNQKAIKDLESIAMDVINGEVEPLTIPSLSIIDQWAVFSFVDIYSICINGTISRDSCVKLKEKILLQYEYFKTRLAYIEVLYYISKKAITSTSGKSCEIIKSLNSGDFLNALKLSLECLDYFENGNIYVKMFEKAVTDKDFKKNAFAAANEEIDELISKHGQDVPYARLIERFYAVANENGIVEMFKQLDPDKFRAMAEEHTPEKTDDIKTLKSIAEKLKAMYGCLK